MRDSVSITLDEFNAMNRRRWCLRPLLASVGNVDQVTVAELAGVSRRTVSRWARDGVPSDWWADELAVRLGRHPAEVWPDW